MQAVLQELIYDSLREGAVWPFDRRYIRPPHFHGQLECLLIRRGSATLHAATQSQIVRPGQLCWILPGVPHVMGDFSRDFDMWVVQLDDALVNGCWAAMNTAEPAGDLGPFEAWSLPLGEKLAGKKFGEKCGHASVRRETDLHIGDGKERVARRDQHVAGERDGYTCARRTAFDGRNDRLAAIADRANEVMQALQPFAPLHRCHVASLSEDAEIAARAEEAFRPGQDDCADLRIGFRLG